MSVGGCLSPLSCWRPWGLPRKKTCFVGSFSFSKCMGWNMLNYSSVNKIIKGCEHTNREFMLEISWGSLYFSDRVSFFKMPAKCHGILFLSPVNCFRNLNKLNILFCVSETHWGNSASLVWCFRWEGICVCNHLLKIVMHVHETFSITWNCKQLCLLSKEENKSEVFGVCVCICVCV